jgi:hypothetical protein
MKTKNNFFMNGNRIKAITLMLFLSASTLMFAQKTNFSGEWNLNATQNDQGEGRGRMAASKIKITQDASSIILEKTSTRPTGEEATSKETITLDGKECENTLFGDRKRKSTASWSADGKSLTINSTMVFERDGNQMEIKSIDVYKLSDDGKTLSLDMTSSSSFGDRQNSLTYTKAN